MYTAEFPVFIRSLSTVSLRTWAYAFAAIFLVSLCGLVGVALVPLLRNAYFDTVGHIDR